MGALDHPHVKTNMMHNFAQWYFHIYHLNFPTTKSHQIFDITKFTHLQPQESKFKTKYKKSINLEVNHLLSLTCAFKSHYRKDESPKAIA
jgi:hypothetical protein